MRAMLQREVIRPFTARCRDSASGAGNEALTSSILAARNREAQVSQARSSALAGLVLLAACGGNTVTPPAAEPVFVPFKPAFRGFVGDASLPEPRGYVSLIEVGGFLYSVGGIPPTAPRPPFVNATPTVYFTRILGDGSLEPWRETASLNVARNRTALVAWNPPGGPRALFALGGHADDLRGLDSVERAFVQPDGTLSPWERMAPLPALLIDGVVSQIGNTVVLTGGFLSADPTAPRLDSVFVGTLGPDAGKRYFDRVSYAAVGSLQLGDTAAASRAEAVLTAGHPDLDFGHRELALARIAAHRRSRSKTLELLQRSADEGVRMIVVTSAGPGEGKSMFSSNLSVSAFHRAGSTLWLTATA